MCTSIATNTNNLAVLTNNELMIESIEMIDKHRSVAQFGSASGLGPEGRRFESYHSDHLFYESLTGFFLCIMV